jgi:hypothetical protein
MRLHGTLGPADSLRAHFQRLSMTLRALPLHCMLLTVPGEGGSVGSGRAGFVEDEGGGPR